MNRIYECMVLLDNREVRQGWDAVKANVADMLTKHNAEILSSKLWEERRLAYPINNQQRGTYLLVYFNAPTGEITPINRELNMAELVMRHMVTSCEALPDDVSEPEKEFDVTKIGTDTPPTPPEPVEEPAAEAKTEAKTEAKAEAGAAAETTEAKPVEAAAEAAPAGDAAATATEEKE